MKKPFAMLLAAALLLPGAALCETMFSGEVTAGFGDVGNQKFPDFPAELDSLPIAEGREVIVAAYAL